MTFEEEDSQELENGDHVKFFDEFDRRTLEMFLKTYSDDQWYNFVENELGRSILAYYRNVRKITTRMSQIGKVLALFSSLDRCLEALSMAKSFEQVEKLRMPVWPDRPAFSTFVEEIYQRVSALGTEDDAIQKIAGLNRLTSQQWLYLKKEVYIDRVKFLEKRLDPKVLEERSEIREKIERIVELADSAKIEQLAEDQIEEFFYLALSFFQNSANYTAVYLDEASYRGW